MLAVLCAGVNSVPQPVSWYTCTVHPLELTISQDRPEGLTAAHLPLPGLLTVCVYELQSSALKRFMPMAVVVEARTRTGARICGGGLEGQMGEGGGGDREYWRWDRNG